MLCNDVFCGSFLSVNIYKLTKKSKINKTKQTKQNKTKTKQKKQTNKKTPKTSLYYVDQWLLFRIPTYEEKCCEKTEV